METLHYKVTLIVFLFIMLFLSCNMRENKNYGKIEELMNGKDISDIDNFIILAPFQCKGCVEDKLIEFIKDSNSIKDSKTILMLDTTTSNFSIIKNKNIKYYHVSSENIEKKFPEIANIYLLNKNDAEKIINADDSSIRYYINNLK